MKFFNTRVLFKEVSASSLGLLRFFFGMVLLVDYSDFHFYFVESLAPSKFYNTYIFFHWVELLPVSVLSIFFYGAMLSCFLFALGIHYRLNAILTFLSWTYIFLIDKGHYNNHFYLTSMLLLFFCVVDADRWGTPIKKEKNTVPYWQILIFRWQFFIVYFYGGIAKLQSDWLSGFPMRYWLGSMDDKFPEFMESFVHSEMGAYLFSWSGLAFDLTIPILLLTTRWRRWALIPVVCFHTMNDYIWSIGVFPTLMLASTMIFFAPNWAENVYKKFGKNKLYRNGLLLGLGCFASYGIYHSDLFLYTNFYIKLLSYPMLTYLFFKGADFQEESNRKTEYFTQKNISLVLLTIWFSVQLLFPFRQWVYKGNPSWTGEGHLFAWRMMLVDTVEAWRMKVIVPGTKEELPIALDQYVNYRQYRKMRRTPDSFLRFAHFIRDEVKKNGVENPIIKMEIWKSVNNRSPTLLNDTTLNYANVAYSSVKHLSWINDWNPADEKPVYTENKYEKWKLFLEKDQIKN